MHDGSSTSSDDVQTWRRSTRSDQSPSVSLMRFSMTDFNSTWVLQIGFGQPTDNREYRRVENEGLGLPVRAPGSTAKLIAVVENEERLRMGVYSTQRASSRITRLRIPSTWRREPTEIDDNDKYSLVSQAERRGEPFPPPASRPLSTTIDRLRSLSRAMSRRMRSWTSTLTEVKSLHG